MKYGGFPEWPKGTDCKSAGDAFGGSNPPSPTKYRAEALPRLGIYFASRWIRNELRRRQAKRGRLRQQTVRWTVCAERRGSTIPHQIPSGGFASARYLFCKAVDSKRTPKAASKARTASAANSPVDCLRREKRIHHPPPNTERRLCLGSVFIYQQNNLPFITSSPAGGGCRAPAVICAPTHIATPSCYLC